MVLLSSKKGDCPPDILQALGEAAIDVHHLLVVGEAQTKRKAGALSPSGRLVQLDMEMNEAETGHSGSHALFTGMRGQGSTLKIPPPSRSGLGVVKAAMALQALARIPQGAALRAALH